MPTGELPMTETGPRFRATIASGRLFLAQWHAGLIPGCGPQASRLRQRNKAGVAIADLSVIRNGPCQVEIIVSTLGGELTPAARLVLLTWATDTGYTRVWLPDSIVDLHDRDAACPRAHATCPSCRSRWEDDSW